MMQEVITTRRGASGPDGSP